MPGWEAAAISAGASLIGIPWQQSLQKDLMHENEAINVRQWERENAYNSPAAQMRRLKEAGLNPDLAIAGNVQNTAGSITPTTGTPQASGAASAVGRGVSNALDAMQVESQVDLNESIAAKNKSETKQTDTITSFLNESFGIRLNILKANLGLTEADTEKVKAQTEQIGMQALVLSKEVENFNELFRNYDVQRKLWNNQAIKEGFQAGISKIDLDRHLDFLNSHISYMESEAGLNKAFAAKLRTETNFLLSTFSDRSQLIHENLLSQKEYNRLTEAQYNYQMSLIRYLPYQMSDIVFNSTKFYERDDNGNIIYGDNGIPKLNEGYVAWMNGYKYVSDVTNTLESLSRTAENVGMGIGAMRGFGFGGSKSGTPFAPQSVQQAVPTSAPRNVPDWKQQKYENLLLRYDWQRKHGDMEGARKTYKQLMKYNPD